MNLILHNAKIFPMEKVGESFIGSVLIEGDRISLIADLASCQAACRGKYELIDLQKKVLLPAFIDTHTHFSEYAKKRKQVDLSGLNSISEIRIRLEEFRRNNPVLPAWILGGGWDKNRLDYPEKFDKNLLDEFFPYTPVALFSKDYHSRCCNSAALKAAGINISSPDPQGGKICRDAQGEPTGILLETASELLEKHIIPLSNGETRKCMAETVPELHGFGLASLHSMEVPAGAQVLAEFCQNSHALRVCRHFYLDEFEAMAASGKKSGDGDDWYRLGGLKLFADGALGSQTAAMFDEYPNSNGNRGILRHSEEELLDLIEKAAQSGFATSVHALGDRAVFTTIKAFQKAKKWDLPLPQRIEHVQSIRAEDVPELKNSGVFCAVQPVHLANDVELIERHWAQTKEQAYSFRSLLDAGITLGFGSDSPIESINPFWGIYTAITRKKALNPKEEPWLPEQRITVWEALHGYTLGAAAASSEAGLKGSIKPGKLADLIVIEDFTRLPDEYWLQARSLLTIVGGEILWRKGV